MKSVSSTIVIKKYILVIAAAGCLLLTGCKKYLDVQPKSSLSDEQLFESEVGFQQALSGVYSQLASRSLYGDNLSMGFVSALANNYGVSGSSAPFVETRALNYTSAEVKAYIDAVWSTSYAAIAGVNEILAKTTENRSVLSDNNYALIRGEALGLRAYLHFELLRLFGPEYTAGQGLKAVPYRTTVDQYSQVPSVTEEVVKLALEDLAAATPLLQGGDPILTGTTNRRIKMNYYAMKGLEARIRLYAGDKAGAAAAAKEVVNSGRFPFVTAAAAAYAAGSRDRLYITEQVFCLRVRDVKTWAENSYFRNNGTPTMRCTRTAANFNTLYETSAGGSTDIRYLYRIETDNGAPFPSKFWQTYQFTTLDSNRLDQLVPMIRLSEMYYILAETAETPAAGAAYLNMVRKNRSLSELNTAAVTATTLTSEITKEYQKEFYAEGQVFYYYKRKNVVRMQFATANIALSKYRLPISDLELEFNPTY